MTADQPARLFDPKTTAPAKCRACGTSRPNLCQYDADREHHLHTNSRRPKTCLNTPAPYNPHTAPIPY